MPPKRKIGQLNKMVQEGPVSTGSILKMFKKIESTDLKFKECTLCHEKVKSCLYKDHLDTKCPNRHKMAVKSEPNTVKEEKDKENNEDDEIIFVTEINTSNSSTKSFSCSETMASNVDNATNRLISVKQEIKEELKEHFKMESLIKAESLSCSSVQSVQISSEIQVSNNSRVMLISSPSDSNELKCTFSHKEPSSQSEEVENENRERRKSLKRPLPLEEENQIGANADCSKLSEDEVLLNDYMDKLETSLEMKEQTKPNIDYYLINFTNAIESVLNEPNYSFLLSEYDSQIVEKFFQLTRKWLPSLSPQTIRLTLSFLSLFFS